jgi:hypothetical protein
MIRIKLSARTMKHSPWVIALLALAVAAPAFGQGGGRGNRNAQDTTDMANGGGRGNRVSRNAMPMDTVNQASTFGGRSNRNGNNPGGPGGGPASVGVSGPGGNPGGGGPGGGGRVRSAFSALPADDEFQILTTTSIFARNRVALQEYTSETPTVTTTVTRAGPAPVFVGVMEDNGGYVAFLEGASGFSGAVSAFKPGDPVSWNNGVIRSVSMDKLKIEANGQMIEINLGNNLRNEPAQPVATYIPPVSLDVTNRGNPAGTGNFANNNNNNANFGGRNQNFGFGGGNFAGGGGGRGGRGNQNFGGNNFGGNFGGNNAFGAAAGNAPTTPVITNDPPLPAGTADDIEARLRQRRAQQVGGGN